MGNGSTHSLILSCTGDGHHPTPEFLPVTPRKEKSIYGWIGGGAIYIWVKMLALLRKNPNYILRRTQSNVWYKMHVHSTPKLEFHKKPIVFELDDVPEQLS